MHELHQSLQRLPCSFLPVVTALNTPLDIEHSSWRCVRSKVGRRLVRRCQEVYFFLSSLRDSPSTYTHRYETTQREVRKRWCGGLWKVIRKVSNFLTFHLQIGYLGNLAAIMFIMSSPLQSLQSDQGEDNMINRMINSN